MTTIYASQLLTPSGWRNSSRIHVSGGRIAALEHDVAPLPADERHDVIVPALPNVHSHAFQRGMAGLAERRGPGEDDFWSWRDTMYRFASRMTPDQLQAVAAQAYVEMLEAGFCRVGEFHYLHHDERGCAYGDIGEMAAHIAAAADATGLGLTLLPVFYAHATFGAAAPRPHQARFIHDVDGYARLIERCRGILSGIDGAVLGVAPHSLRAVTPDELGQVLKVAAGLGATAPIHMHIAEQTGEVADCLAWSGSRPVRWLLDHCDVGRNWCLVHATHVDAGELAGIAASGAVAGLCPITEANLGDGLFPLAGFLEQGGLVGIGTDSNVCITAAGELSLLEYGQRLAGRVRNVASGSAGGSTGHALFQRALAGGSIALGTAGNALEQGAAADMLSLATEDPALLCRKGDALLDSWIFASAQNAVDCVWVAGRKLVEHRRHLKRDEIRRRYERAMKELCD